MASAILKSLSQPTPDTGKSQSLYVLASTFYSKASELDDPHQLAQALGYAEQSHLANPTNLQTLNLLARIHLKQGNHDQAATWAQLGLQQKPNSPALLYTAGLVALEQHDFEQAESCFSQSAAISRVATRAPQSLAHLHLLQGRYQQAFQEFAELLRSQPGDRHLQTKLLEAAAGVTPNHYDAGLAEQVLACFEFDGDIGLLDRISMALLKHRMALLEQQQQLTLEQLQQEPLLLQSCRHFPIADTLLEQLLRTARFSLLQASVKTLSFDASQQPLILALIQQTERNEGCWSESEDESQQLLRLQQLADRLLQLGDEAMPSAVAVVSLILMYRPLSATQLRQRLSPAILMDAAWPTELQSLLADLLGQQQALELHASVIPLLPPDQHDAEHPSAASDDIQALYQSNPYPRWQYLGNYPQSGYIDTVQRQFPHRLAHLQPGKTADVLVAGCGTGRQALRLARFFSDLQVTAIDLSLPSLAYGRSRQLDYGVSIDWLQANLLDIERLGQSFEVIECSGVLHHMANPLAGLMTLASVLKPGGIIKLALYSRTARQGILQLRQQLHSSEISSRTEIQQLRYGLMEGDLARVAGLNDSQRREILSSRDFYTVSGCRDLLCNPVEHLFDIADIEHWLSRAGLQWAGMLARGDAVQLAQQVFGLAANELTPAQWQQLEAEAPKLFAGMYQFYAFKPLESALHVL
ncbi:class I SAM-dependent methyltransferase [Oceanobacter mangrovi]|uniref:class I SAM-dependent methyltransferase n=1 Tax=Oceanobacter mangrovi TaxID=2862510 RepID=UPI001C8E63D0|nr:class I SAM-dependent methyltransferase [Oceanobacter mangrovi]